MDRCMYEFMYSKNLKLTVRHRTFKLYKKYLFSMLFFSYLTKWPLCSSPHQAPSTS